jgi:hypothetical protein
MHDEAPQSNLKLVMPEYIKGGLSRFPLFLIIREQGHAMGNS